MSKKQIEKRNEKRNTMPATAAPKTHHAITKPAKKVQSTKRPAMATPVDLSVIVNKLSKLKTSGSQILSDFVDGSIGIYKAGKSVSTWRRHAEAEAFIYILEGSTSIALQSNEEDFCQTKEMKTNSFLLIPKSFWYRFEVANTLLALCVAPGATEEVADKNPIVRNATDKVTGNEKSGEDDGAKTKAKSKNLALPAIESTAKGYSAKDFVTQVRDYALSFPETSEESPWGHPAFKVRSKTFVWLSFSEIGINLTVKLTHSRLQVESLPFIEVCGYGLGQHGWLTAKINLAEGNCSIETVKRWIDESFHAVAPKSVLKEMGEVPGIGIVKRTPKASGAGKTAKRKPTEA